MEKTKIDKIIENPTLSVKEKIDKLEELKVEFNQIISSEKEKLLKDYEYCPYCNTYYKKKGWDFIDIEKEESYFVDNSYEDHCSLSTIASYWSTRQVPYIVKICPVGHKREERA